MAIGLIHETWVKIITNRFLKSHLRKRYPTLDFAGDQALEKLLKLFGSSNIISTIRNNFAFHYPYDKDVEAAFERAMADNVWDGEWLWFFSESNFNSFYYVSDVVVVNGIMNAIGKPDVIEAQKGLMKEVQTALNEMAVLIMALTSVLWRAHFGNEFEAKVCAEITAAPHLFEFALPFFVDTSGAPE